MQHVIGAQNSFDRQLPDTSHLTRVNLCGKFAAVQRGVCLYAWAAARHHGITAARQHGSTAARQHSGILSSSALHRFRSWREGGSAR